MRTATAAIALCAALAATPMTRAQPAPDPGRAGLEAAARGDLTGAIALFKQARAAGDRPEWICNIGNAYAFLGELPRAHLFLAQCVARTGALDPAGAASFHALLADVEARLRAGAFAAIDVTVVPAAATVGASVFADDERAPGSRVIWLPAGTHTVTARAEGFQDRVVTIEVTGGEPQAVTLALAPIAAPPPPPPPPPDAPPPAAIVVEPGATRTVHPTRRVAVIAFAGGALAVGAGAFFHRRALATRDDIAAHHPYAGPERSAREDTWRGQVTGMAIGYGVGAAAIGVGVYLWLRTGHAPALAAGPDRVSLALHF